jgi:hypothetical protein
LVACNRVEFNERCIGDRFAYCNHYLYCDRNQRGGLYQYGYSNGNGLSFTYGYGQPFCTLDMRGPERGPRGEWCFLLCMVTCYRIELHKLCESYCISNGYYNLYCDRNFG